MDQAVLPKRCMAVLTIKSVSKKKYQEIFLFLYVVVVVVVIITVANLFRGHVTAAAAASTVKGLQYDPSAHKNFFLIIKLVFKALEVEKLLKSSQIGLYEILN